MPTLTDAMKVALVQAQACYDTPTQAAEAVSQEFGIKIDRVQASKYDPTKESGKRLSPKLKAIFESTRKAFLETTADIPIAQQSFRLRVLQRQLQKAEQAGNQAMVAQLLEQAAKESGGAFTNRREITGKGGGPIQQQTSNVTPEQLDEAVRKVREEF